MKSNVIKECVICFKEYHPDKRAVDRQKTCDDLKCKIKYKQITNKQWRNKKENLDYFKGRYNDLVDWLEEHPGYLKNYRSRKKKSCKHLPNDIKAQLTPYNNNRLEFNTVTLLNDIQAELTSTINNRISQIKERQKHKPD